MIHQTPSPNPFSTRHIKPGAIPYHRIDGGQLDDIVSDYLGKWNRWAAIIGPHGSGKSTLVATIRPMLMERGYSVEQHIFSTSRRKWIDFTRASQNWNQSSIILVDGYEQLSTLFQWRLRNKIRRRRSGLLVTAHATCLFIPTLWQTSVDDQQADWVLHHLLTDQADLADEIKQDPIWLKLKQTHPDNLRERLMDLYDWVEIRRRERAKQSLD